MNNGITLGIKWDSNSEIPLTGFEHNFSEIEFSTHSQTCHTLSSLLIFQILFPRNTFLYAACKY
jgi:hypothetical protein